MTITPAIIGALSHQASVPADDHFSSVVMLSHFDEAGGSPTDPVNSCPRGTTLVLHGTAFITGTSPKFGTGCLSTASTGSGFLESGTSSDYSLGSGDYTIEFWMKTATPSQTANVIKSDGAVLWGLLISSSKFTFSDSSSSTGAVGSVSTSTWQFIAITRSGTAVRLFVDGTQVGNFTSSAGYNGTTIRLGNSFGGGFLFTGNYDDIRITKGYCRYTSAFTPPIAAFPDQ
jgi:Concanavalin A-like lectin/glucanases superfamily